MAERGQPALSKRVLCGFRSNVGVSVVIAADPGSKFDDTRQRNWRRAYAVYRFNRIAHLLIQFWNRLQQHRAVIEAHLDFIEHGRGSAANLIALPPACDL